MPLLPWKMNKRHAELLIIIKYCVWLLMFCAIDHASYISFDANRNSPVYLSK